MKHQENKPAFRERLAKYLPAELVEFALAPACSPPASRVQGNIRDAKKLRRLLQRIKDLNAS